MEIEKFSLFSFYIYLILLQWGQLVKFFSFPLFILSSQCWLIHREDNPFLYSFSGRCWEGFSGWNLKKKEKFLHKGNGNWLLFRAEEKLKSSQSEEVAEPLWCRAAGTCSSWKVLIIWGSPVLDDVFLGDNASENNWKITTTWQNNTDISKAVYFSVWKHHQI